MLSRSTCCVDIDHASIVIDRPVWMRVNQNYARTSLVEHRTTPPIPSPSLPLRSLSVWLLVACLASHQPPDFLTHTPKRSSLAVYIRQLLRAHISLRHQIFAREQIVEVRVKIGHWRFAISWSWLRAFGLCTHSYIDALMHFLRH